MGAPYLSLTLDVTAALPPPVAGDSARHIAAWIFLPEPGRITSRPTMVTLLHGGTYDKRYWHCCIAGDDSYSAAEFLRDQGHVVVLLDHLGIGESSHETEQVTRHRAAAASHNATIQIRDMLRAGTLREGFPPLPEIVCIGGGHSMGAMLLITQQAIHRTFDLAMVLGYSAFGSHIQVDGKMTSLHPGDLDPGQPVYLSLDRKPFRHMFHWDDVSADVIDFDDTLCVPVPYALVTQSLMEGIVREDAAAINVPLYICFGERDVSPDPYAEPGYYRSSPDIHLHILPHSGHCHTFASSRGELFKRMDGWIRMMTTSS
jgi:pimeloyl-ACP methyl ester carboxylesterase